MVQLTPDEVATAVMRRQGRGVGVTLLTLMTGALWLLAAACTVFLIAEYRPDWRAAHDSVGRLIRDAEPKPGAAAGTPATPALQPRFTNRIADGRVFQSGWEMDAPPAPPPGWHYPSQAELTEQTIASNRQMARVLWWAVWQLAGIAAIFVAALLGTFLLVMASRRATLRQVQGVLADISKQLAAIQASGGP